MAFCNSCGTSLEAGARFCLKCGAPVPAAAVPVAAAPSPSAPPLAAAPPAQSSSALKIILIVVAVIIGLGILGVGTAAFLVHRVITRTHVTNKNGEVKVETPFGTVESDQDAKDVSPNLGVDMYPGASVVKNSSANMTFGSMHTAAAEFETSDPPATVNDFYKSKFPNASVMSSQGDHYSIVAGDKSNLITINIEPKDGQTHIHIARVTRPGGSE